TGQAPARTEEARRLRLPARRGPGCSHRLPRGHAAPQRHRRPPRWGPCDPHMGSGPVAAVGRERAVAAEDHVPQQLPGAAGRRRETHPNRIDPLVLDILGRKMTPQTPADGISGPDGPRSSVEGARKKRIWLYVLLAAVVLAALYVVVGFFSGRVLTPGTTVAG